MRDFRLIPATPSSLDVVKNAMRPGRLWMSEYGPLLLDHCRRSIRALEGFGVYGSNWLRPWTTYCLLPLLKRLVPGQIAHFNDFNARLDECDLYTFANIFEDYPVRDIERALDDVELIVDVGANVGAFSYLIAAL